MNALFKLGWVSGSGGRPHPTFLWQACSYFRRCKYENNFTDRWTDNTQSEELAFSSVELKIVGMKKDNSFSTFKNLFLLSHVNKYQTRNHKISPIHTKEMSCTFNEIKDRFFFLQIPVFTKCLKLCYFSMVYLEMTPIITAMLAFCLIFATIINDQVEWNAYTRVIQKICRLLP